MTDDFEEIAELAEVADYKFFHIASELGEQVPVGQGTEGGGTFLGTIIVGSGGEFTLTLYNGSGATAPVVTTITNPHTGVVLPFNCVLDQGLTCTLNGARPGDVTITYVDVES